MIHQEFNISRITVSCRVGIYDAVFLRHLPVLMDTVPSIQLCFGTGSLPEGCDHARFEIGLTPRNTRSMISEKLGQMTFSAYQPRSVPQPRGWVAYSQSGADLQATKLGRKIFAQDPLLNVPGISAAITAMKSAKLAAILPDMVAGRDPDLHCITQLDTPHRYDLWLSRPRHIKDPTGVAQAREWITQCIAEAAWLNRQNSLNPGA